MGTALLDRLVELARESGISRFVADTLTTNTRMLRLLADLSPVRSAGVANGCTHVVLEIPPIPTCRRIPLKALTDVPST